MSKTYFKTISLIEWIYLDKEKILLQRDWSKYFDFEIKIAERNIFEKWLLEYEDDEQKKWKKISKLNIEFIDWLKNILKNNYSIYDIVDSENIKYILGFDYILNDRIYWILNDEILLKSILWYIISYNFSLKNSKTLNISLDDIKVKRKFNFKSFFLQNEALFDANNDFFNTWQNSKKIRTLAWKLKETDENWKKIHLQTIENRIKTWEIKEEHIFRVDVNFDNKLLDLKDIKIEWNKEYNFLFFERNDYLVFDVNK